VEKETAGRRKGREEKEEKEVVIPEENKWIIPKNGAGILMKR
jgi:hypothetical protein